MSEAVGARREDCTVEDLKNLPEGTHAELIDGELFDMEVATPTHQDIVAQLVIAIGQYLKDKKGDCRVYTAPTDVFLDAKVTGRHCFQPDVFVVCDKDKVRGDGIYGAPDWVIEVLSTSTALKDRYLKTYHYGIFGVKEYWIIDPKAMEVKVYRFPYDSESDGASYSFDEELGPSLYPDLTIKIADMLP